MTSLSENDNFLPMYGNNKKIDTWKVEKIKHSVRINESRTFVLFLTADKNWKEYHYFLATGATGTHFFVKRGKRMLLPADPSILKKLSEKMYTFIGDLKSDRKKHVSEREWAFQSKTAYKESEYIRSKDVFCVDKIKCHCLLILEREDPSKGAYEYNICFAETEDFENYRSKTRLIFPGNPFSWEDGPGITDRRDEFLRIADVIKAFAEEVTP